MQKQWQNYQSDGVEICCDTALYEESESLALSHPFLSILEREDKALEENSIYVGSVISKEASKYYYYFKEAHENSIEDHGWQHYHQTLYPSMQEWQSIENQLLCQALADQGIDLSQKQTLKHKLTFQSEYKKASMIEDLEEEGFEIEKEFMNDEGYHGLYFMRQDKATLESIDTLSVYLKDFLKVYDAQYEGWEVV